MHPNASAREIEDLENEITIAAWQIVTYHEVRTGDSWVLTCHEAKNACCKSIVYNKVETCLARVVKDIPCTEGKKIMISLPKKHTFFLMPIKQIKKIKR